jgi:hypothetical protein
MLTDLTGFNLDCRMKHASSVDVEKIRDDTETKLVLDACKILGFFRSNYNCSHYRSLLILTSGSCQIGDQQAVQSGEENITARINPAM